jgi:hypothetical protein
MGISRFDMWFLLVVLVLGLVLGSVLLKEVALEDFEDFHDQFLLESKAVTEEPLLKDIKKAS